MKNSLLYLTFGLATIGVVAGIQCFNCFYQKNDRQKTGTTSCRRPDPEDEANLLVPCVGGVTQCTFLMYNDSATKQEYVSRGCGCSTSLAVTSFGVMGQRQCCDEDNCNGDSTLHACAILVALGSLLALVFRV